MELMTVSVMTDALCKTTTINGPMIQPLMGFLRPPVKYAHWQIPSIKIEAVMERTTGAQFLMVVTLGTKLKTSRNMMPTKLDKYVHDAKAVEMDNSRFAFMFLHWHSGLFSLFLAHGLFHI